MIKDGLLKRFPFDEIYGLHNMPGLPMGHFQTRQGGPYVRRRQFRDRPRGAWAAMRRGRIGGARCWSRLARSSSTSRLIVSRRLSRPMSPSSPLTELLTNGTRNVLPGRARILGDVRSFSPQVSAAIETEMRRIADGLALVYACKASVSYSREFVLLLNDPSLTNEAMTAAATVFPLGAVETAAGPMTASEDFARFPGTCSGMLPHSLETARDQSPCTTHSTTSRTLRSSTALDFAGAIVRKRLKPIV